uniref:Endonuclease/exonuclease/phosphatase domain-containing protein n=1 Tax=Sipha flava TaxID=143950 RepID=A0A2S2Q6Z7_9HEMI
MELNICNIYLPYQHIFNKNNIENILYQIPKPFIMTGDFNSHSTEWGSIKIDNRGKEIEKMLENDHLVLLNNLEPTRINPINGELLCIDLSFSNASLAQRTDWNVLPNLSSSDHFPILIQIFSRHNDTYNSAERWNLKNPNWPLFTEFLESEISKIKNPEKLSINQLTETITSHIINSGNLTIGKSKTKNQKSKVPLWNQNIKDALLAKKEALKIFKKTNNSNDFIILEQLRAKPKYL